MAPDSNSVSSPSRIAGILLFGLIARKAGSNCSSFVMSSGIAR